MAINAKYLAPSIVDLGTFHEMTLVTEKDFSGVDGFVLQSTGQTLGPVSS